MKPTLWLSGRFQSKVRFVIDRLTVKNHAKHLLKKSDQAQDGLYYLAFLAGKDGLKFWPWYTHGIVFLRDIVLALTPGVSI